MVVASLMRDKGIGKTYDRLCWIPVGQTPDLCRLLGLLHRQLARGERPPDAEVTTRDLMVLAQRVKTAAQGLSILCVLDDVWDPSHGNKHRALRPSP